MPVGGSLSTTALTVVSGAASRFLSKVSPFDIIVAIMLGSIMSSAINGSVPFFPTVVAGAVILALHWLFATIAFHVDWFGPFVKGKPALLIKDGRVQEDEMQRRGITPHDLNQALRQSRQTDPSKIEAATLERDGNITVIPTKNEPRILDVSVEDGVQIVRIALQQ